MPQNYNLDVKKTIETTFSRAKGWWFAKYPSRLNPKANFEIDVRYPGEAVPSSQCEIFTSPMCSKIEFDKEPVFITFKRGDNEISLKRNVFKGSGREEVSYIFAVHTHSGLNYRVIQTPEGMIRGVGNHLLLQAVQKDKDFGKYISFFWKDGEKSISQNTSRWPLTEIMTASRTSRE